MDNNIFETDQNQIKEISSEQIISDDNLENNLEKNNKLDDEDIKIEDEDQHILDDVETKPINDNSTNIKSPENKKRFNFNMKYVIIGVIAVLIIIIIILVCITLFFPKVDNKLVTDLQKTVVDDNIKITDLTSQINTLKDKQKYIITSNKQLQEENDDLKKCLQKYCNIYDSKIQNIETKINKEPIIVQQTEQDNKVDNTIEPKIEEAHQPEIKPTEPKIEEVKDDPEVKKIISELI